MRNKHARSTLQNSGSVGPPLNLLDQYQQSDGEFSAGLLPMLQQQNARNQGRIMNSRKGAAGAVSIALNNNYDFHTQAAAAQLRH